MSEVASGGAVVQLARRVLDTDCHAGAETPLLELLRKQSKSTKQEFIKLLLEAGLDEAPLSQDAASLAWQCLEAAGQSCGSESEALTRAEFLARERRNSQLARGSRALRFTGLIGAASAREALALIKVPEELAADLERALERLPAGD